MARSNLLAAALLVLALRWVSQAFVAAPGTQVQEVALRGAPAALAAGAAALPLAASAADELIEYNNAGEWTPYMIIGYFTITTGCTIFAFLCYLILTKIKII
mmetsp:Transcript_68494/g.120979  ORF Transcript_68494/g.120979 Transcript_68494/m.120979 type:complete len:102 (-) Transcript_68494:76-381(-)|eukprot:CAMPEP_0197619734 /NCGR_PEP_ID=MMETSP1338-20131121/725_1 /TAXON_ID=43686 ORGANISM="Pelagodinium beii, Strain RCC1491" /NCGR_SAMPLE_ID=MMETSP1338 /ASSEMBLY_ACC=CAM_ASM_000754 /LENGTH=101 /DNA_ID=CAMNT_0043188761 /DNA_START=66 /DNA_END=371 /DNA_ORIENTATION=-